VLEHPVIVKRSNSVQWKREVFDLDQKKLATLKASHGWTNEELARHSRVSVSTVKIYLYDYDRTGNKKGDRGNTGESNGCDRKLLQTQID
jgi:hypothetical protein